MYEQKGEKLQHLISLMGSNSTLIKKADDLKPHINKYNK